MSTKNIKGGWLRCEIKNKKYSCTLDKSRGHIIPNKGGKFTVDELVFSDLNYQASIGLTQSSLYMRPGLDKIIDCVFETGKSSKKLAHCEILR